MGEIRAQKGLSAIHSRGSRPNGSVYTLRPLDKLKREEDCINYKFKFSVVILKKSDTRSA